MSKPVHTPLKTYEVPNSRWANVVVDNDVNPVCLEDTRAQQWDIYRVEDGDHSFKNFPALYQSLVCVR